MNAEPPDGPVPRMSIVAAYMPFAQLAENVDCALLMARSDPIADASLPEMRARSRPGTAIAAMMPMIATTISSSIRVKPFWLRIFMTNYSFDLPMVNGSQGSGIAGLNSKHGAADGEYRAGGRRIE